MTTLQFKIKKYGLPNVLNWMSGETLFILVGTLVSGMNMLHNLLMGRMLIPTDYGQLTFFVTLLMIVGLLTTGLQTLVSRFVANYSAQGFTDSVYQLVKFSNRISLIMGISIAVALIIFAPALSDIFRLSTPTLFYVIAASIPFYLRIGVDRGYLQGMAQYGRLSLAYGIEAVVRLVGSVIFAYLLLTINMSLFGAIVALSLSILMTWWITHPKAEAMTEAVVNRSNDNNWSAFLAMTLLALVGQALITNSDFLMVKMYFSPLEAGYYAAVSIIGRIVYFGTLPITIVMTPMLAKQQALGQSTQKSLTLIMGAGLFLCSALIVGAFLFAPQIIILLYGHNYLSANPLLAPYTIAASLFVMTNLLVTYRIALGKTGETILPLLAGVAQMIGIVLFHETLMQVIIVQMSVMSCLFVATIVRIMIDKTVE